MGTKIRVRKDNDEWDVRDVDSDPLERDGSEAPENPGDDGGDMPDMPEMDGDSADPGGDGSEGDGGGDESPSDDEAPSETESESESDGESESDADAMRWRCNAEDPWANYGVEGASSDCWFAGPSGVALMLEYHTPPGGQVTPQDSKDAADDFRACVVAREETVPTLRKELKKAGKATAHWVQAYGRANESAARKDRLLTKLVGVLDAMADDTDSEYLSGWITQVMAEIDPPDDEFGL